MADKYPKVLTNRQQYGDEFDKDCTFTDPEAVVSLVKYGLLDNNLTYLEPCCGNGSLSKILHRNGYQVTSSDLLDWDYGIVKDIRSYNDKSCDVVLTNPPFSKWEMILRESIRIARKRIFMLWPLRYLEGQYRSHVLKETNLTGVLIFSYRVKMYRPEGKRLSGLTAYAWYYWDLDKENTNISVDWLYR